MSIEQESPDRKKRSLWKVAAYVSLAASVILLVCVLVLLLFPDTYINKFLKGQIINGLTKAYPAYSIKIADVHYKVSENSIEVDSITIKAKDSTFSCHIAELSLRGVGWMKVLREGSIAPRCLTNSIVHVQQIVMTFGENTFHCQQLRVSVPDSSIVAEALELHPLVNDEQFFANSKFKRTRCRLVIPQCRVIGADFLGMMQENIYRIHSAHVDSVSLDLMLNMDKPFDINSPSPPMPHELLSSIKGTLQIDSLYLQGRVKYSERFAVGTVPGVVTFDDIKMSVEGIANRTNRGTPINIHAQAKFMNSGAMTVHMSIPVASADLSLRYYGSLGKMDMNKINQYLEIAEHTRIKSGILQEAKFDINVTAGHARGSVRGVYKDFSIAVLDKHTGSETGLVNRVTSFIANLFKLRKSNIPDKSGKMKIGVVDYTRKPDETFIQFIWPALRGGLGNVAGF
ncbi:MAG: hypothetical protein NTX44_03810 [Ignavibacteriales bacterium]|nr:hypothetical protein [Ignavibacteriales bacterium]